MTKHALWLVAGLGVSACAMPELVSPESGSCSAAIDGNRWPKFEGNDGEVPVYDPSEVGWGEGLVPPDFELVDQHGDSVCLWQMVGKYVVLDASALWCEPCKQIAEKLACNAESLGEDVVFMTFITQDVSSQPALQEHAEAWSDAYGLGAEGLLTPVIADGQQVVTSGFTGQTLPSLVLLDRDLRWIIAGQNAGAELPIKNELERATGNSSCSEE